MRTATVFLKSRVDAISIASWDLRDCSNPVGRAQFSRAYEQVGRTARPPAASAAGPLKPEGTNVQHLPRSDEDITGPPLCAADKQVVAVLDDDESVSKAFVRLLRAAGYAARGFTSGQDLLKHWPVDPPDCLVLDLQMPGLSGAEVHQALKRAGAKFPVIAISAHDAAAMREEAMSHGAVAYLRKPVDAHVLVNAVRSAANRIRN
jgi:CheY-like chemotaxis protein